MDKQKPKKEQAEVHEDLEGFEIKVDPFGNIRSNMDIDQIKGFLDKHMDDKKLAQLKNEEE